MHICFVESRNNPPPMNLGRNWHVRYVLLLHQVIPFCIILPHSPKWSDNKLLNLSGLNRICWEIWLQLLVWSREKAVVKNSKPEVTHYTGIAGRALNLCPGKTSGLHTVPQTRWKWFSIWFGGCCLSFRLSRILQFLRSSSCAYPS